MNVQLVAMTQGVWPLSPEDLLTRAFSQCYQKPANIDVVLRNLDHESVLEHISFTFEIQVSRVCWEQLVRHRIASYTAQSHRYTEPTLQDMADFIPSDIPTEYLTDWVDDANKIHQMYKKWRGRGVQKQTARYLLPKGVAIRATVTMNLRSLLNFLELRTGSHAQEEIKLLAEEMWKQVKPYFPRLGDALEEKFRGGKH